MKKHIIAFIMVVAATATASAQVAIERNTLGSGEQGVKGFENSTLVLDNDIYHAPQYMAAYPTAATIWPRVVDVQCIRVGTSVQALVDKNGETREVISQPKLKCQGYEWTPKMGRGEYLFFRPQIVEPEPVAPVVEIRERTIIREVPQKKIHQ